MSDASGIVEWLASSSASMRRATSEADVRKALDASLSKAPGKGAEVDVASAELRAVAVSAVALLHAQAELAASLKARESLLATVSHDLRNPLNTFAMSVGLLREDLTQPEIDRARGQSLLERMQRASHRMQHLIEDLLEASRIEAGNLDLRRKNVSAREAIEKAVAEHRPAAEEKRAHLGVDVDGEPTVHADQARLVQTLAKIVGYALKNVSEGGSVLVHAEASGGTTRFTVKGVVPGYRPEPIKVEEGRGGLALLIARGLVRAHGSTLDIQTDDATTYAFSLPSAS